jgi:hypothetical protein
MRVLIYKRTHVGDPSDKGVFGCHDCMGTVRGREYSAVIGIGGVGAEPRSFGIDGKVNWVGIGPHKAVEPRLGSRRPLVTFDHFSLFDNRGPEVASIAPGLAKHMYETNRRVVMSDSLPANLQAEVQEIVRMASDSPGSMGLGGATKDPTSCAPRSKVKCR